MYFDDLARQWLNGLGPRLSAMEDENGEPLLEEERDSYTDDDFSFDDGDDDLL